MSMTRKGWILGMALLVAGGMVLSGCGGGAQNETGTVTEDTPVVESEAAASDAFEKEQRQKGQL